MSGTPVHRVEKTDSGIKVIFLDWMSLADPRKITPLEKEHPQLFTDVDRKEFVKVGSGVKHESIETDFGIHGGNGIYYKVPLNERELTEEETKWCESTFIYGENSPPETLFEFTIPSVEILNTAVQENDSSFHEKLTSVIKDSETRHQLLTKFQENHVTESIKNNKLRHQNLHDGLEPEWDPELSQKDKDTLQHMAGMRADSHLLDLKEILGFDYYKFVAARARILEDFNEPDLDVWEFPALGVAGYDRDDWSYCRKCGVVALKENILHPEVKGLEDRTQRLCEFCAEKSTNITDQAIAKEKDRIALEFGGQRRIEGDY